MEHLPGVPDEGVMLLPGGDDVPLLLDVTTGETRSAEQDETPACFKRHPWTHETPLDRQSPQPEDRSTAFLSYVCSIDGDPIELQTWFRFR